MCRRWPLPADPSRVRAVVPLMMASLPGWHSPAASEKCSHSRNGPLITPSVVLHVEACLLEKIVGRSRALLPGFQREFKVLLQMIDPSSEGKVQILILIKSSSPHWGGAGTQSSAWNPGSLERENVHSSDFLSTAVMSSLDEAMQPLEIGQDTVQEPLTKAV
ncbi:unnamed protein product [Nyctereutes procyonoides]|uniref:(raccoon dog) hypothetical protein n=1 Tax=Nyctereutes procyonoides TaxID=34880 RepID=A0A811Y0C2_NYCPR|nr:unnamed protein product [Nyctereutes procyonoides]